MAELSKYWKMRIRMSQIMEQYGETLVKLIKAKSNVRIPTTFYDRPTILFLERFVHLNGLFDTKEVWQPFKKEYEELSRKLIEPHVKRYKEMNSNENKKN